MRMVEANLPLLEADDDHWVLQRITRGVCTAADRLKPRVIIDCAPLLEPVLEGRFFLDMAIIKCYI